MDIMKTGFILLSFVISLVLGGIIIPRIILIAKRKRLFDKLDARKEAKPPIPRLGGLAFFPVAMFSFSLMLGMRYFLGLDLPHSSEANLILNLMFVIAGLIMIFFIGLADDLIEVNFRTKFFVQFICAAILMFAGIAISNMQGLFFLYTIPVAVSVILSILFVILTVNAYNLIDGVNGLCSGLGLIALSAYSGWYIYVGNYVYAMLALSMAGIVLAFFYYNVRGRRLQIFMGDTGSLTLGFIISFLTLKFISSPHGGMNDEFYTPVSTLALIIGLLFIPLFDTIRVFVNRVNKGLSPFHPDRTHVHHKLLNIGFTHIQSTLILMLAQVCFLLINVLLSDILLLHLNIVFAIDIALALSINQFLNVCINRKRR